MKKKTNRKTQSLSEIADVAIIITAIILFLVFVFMGISTGIERHEIMECKQWIKMEKEIDNFYWTDWQLDQCKHHGFSDADMGN